MIEVVAELADEAQVPARSGESRFEYVSRLWHHLRAHGAEVPEPRTLHGRGDAVVVEAHVADQAGGARPVWCVYRFEGVRIVEAAAFESEAAAWAHVG